MKYLIIKLYKGNVELNLSKKTILLTDLESKYTVDEDEYEEILSKYESLIVNELILVQRIEPKVEAKEDKKINKK